MADMLFVSTRFLFPVDSGGKIRTTQILRGLKGGRFRVVLASPVSDEQLARHRDEIDLICDEFHGWRPPNRGPWFHYTRLRHIVSRLPIPVRTDRHPEGLATVDKLLKKPPTVAVFDFAHAGVLAPAALDVPSVMFTHNVEAEIFRRHVDVSNNVLARLLWRNQYQKMFEFESECLSRFDTVVAVADRDSAQFVEDYGVENPHVIPTGVDLEFFGFAEPSRNRDIVFCGSMDWLANQEGVRYFMDDVWQKIVDAVPDAKMTVVGRAAPDSLKQEARRRSLPWEFTGFVDDVRPYVQGSAVSVIPLRVGGGTRLKAYEAMAMGSPIVSTSIGMEGLPAQAGRHYLCADDADAFAAAVVQLLHDDTRRYAIARESRAFVEENFSYHVAAASFEAACVKAIERFEVRSAR